jgi:hypothetical protein
MEEVNENSVEEEVVLHFKRFAQEKQDQVRALVNYATLMGLDGKDLVSIGGRLNRIAANREMKLNEHIVSSMNIRPIGQDKNCYNRWAYTDSSGVIYHFKCSYSRYDITNTVTKKTARGYANEYYNVGRRFHIMENRELPNIMLNIYHGNVALP